MVLQYQSWKQQATCEPTSTESSNVKKIYWKANQSSINSTKWTPDTKEDWDPKPVCHGVFNGIGECQKPLHYTLYSKYTRSHFVLNFLGLFLYFTHISGNISFIETPDAVTINSLGDASSAYEGMELQLQCEVVDVAPAQSITVRWMASKGNRTIELGMRSFLKCPHFPIVTYKLFQTTFLYLLLTNKDLNKKKYLKMLF